MDDDEDPVFKAQMNQAVAASLRDVALSSSGSYDDGEEGEDNEDDDEEGEDADGDNLADSGPSTTRQGTRAVVKFASYDRRGLVARQTALLNELQETTQLGREAGRALATAYRWNIADAANAFIADPERLCQRLGIDYAASKGASLADEEAQVRQGSCAICFEEQDLLGLSCSHVYCRACWSDVVAEQVQARNALVIHCPGPECKQILGSLTASTLLNGPLR
jgi:hypothetical protein